MRALALALTLAAGGPEDVGEPATDSLYNLKAPFTDQAGRRVKLGDLEGSVVVMAMVYASCEGACPILVSDVQRIERQLPDDVRAKVRFVLVTFDPKRDTPAQLARYAKARGLSSPRWTLLTSDDDTVRELAALLGMRYRRLENGDFVHSNLITVLDARGVIAHRVVGLGQEPGEAVKAISRLASAPR
jgi:protein SCO1/2